MVVINLTKVNIKSGNYLDEVNHNQEMTIYDGCDEFKIQLITP